VDNVTASSSLGTLVSDDEGYLEEGSFTADVGDIVELSHATYTGRIRFTLQATQEEAYTAPENDVAAFIVQNDFTTTNNSTYGEVYYVDTDTPDMKPVHLARVQAGITNLVPYQTAISRDLRLFLISQDDEGQFGQQDFAYAEFDDITVPGLSAPGIDGSGAATRIAYWSDADTLTSNANLTFDGTTFKVGSVTPTAAPFISAIGQGNAFMWGHQASTTYHNSLGATITNGYPFLVFHGEGGTGDTFTTRGGLASIIRSDLAGGLVIGTVANNNAANQSLIANFQMTAAGKFVFGSGGSNCRMDVVTLAPSDQMTLGTAPQAFGIGSGTYGLYMNSSVSGNCWMQVGRADGSATAYHLNIQAAGGNVSIGHNAPNAKLDIIATTEQLRVGYDTSNYFKTTVGSTGGVTFDAVGSGAKFTFSDDIELADGKNILAANTTGSSFGSSSSKLSVYGETPVVQAGAIGQLTDSTGGSPGATLIDVDSGGVADVSAVNDNFASLAAKVNALEAAVKGFGISA
jgi:hypothetical protein